jgi:cell division protein FtsW (lipid II flippase)
LLIVPSLMAVVGLLTIFLVPRRDTAFTWRDIWISLAFVALLYILNLWFSAIGFQGDQLLLPITATMAGLGLIIIQRLHPVLERQDPPLTGVSQRQAFYIAVGFGLLWGTVVLFRQLHLLRRYKYLVGFTAIGLMVLTMLVGTDFGQGAKLWIVVGPIAVQPGEAVKLLLVFFMAAYLDDKRELLASEYRLGPAALAADPVPPAARPDVGAGAGDRRDPE